jgi:hypothetical protein
VAIPSPGIKQARANMAAMHCPNPVIFRFRSTTIMAGALMKTAPERVMMKSHTPFNPCWIDIKLYPRKQLI